MENQTPYQQGVQASKDGKSIFDYPFKVGSQEYEEWMDGYMAEDKIVRFNQAGV
jgi:hypothetical protein